MQLLTHVIVVLKVHYGAPNSISQSERTYHANHIKSRKALSS